MEELLYSLELERASIISSAVQGQVEYLFLHTTWDLLAIPSSAARSYSALAEAGFTVFLPFPNKEIIKSSSEVLSDTGLASSSHTSCLPQEQRSMELTSWKRESGSGPRAADAALLCLDLEQVKIKSETFYAAQLEKIRICRLMIFVIFL